MVPVLTLKMQCGTGGDIDSMSRDACRTADMVTSGYNRRVDVHVVVEQHQVPAPALRLWEPCPPMELLSRSLVRSVDTVSISNPRRAVHYSRYDGMALGAPAACLV